jgi:cytochrome c-type biogenesis protein
MGEAFQELARGGPLLLAIGAAALAGLVSFLSPCVLPLVPGYLSYVTGLAGTDLERGQRSAPAHPIGGPGGGRGSARTSASGGVATASPPAPVAGRVLAGTLLFVAGFAVTFTAMAVLFAGVGRALFEHKRALEIVIGVLIIALGLAFVGLVPATQRELRIHRLPQTGLAGAPVFGAVFALSWVPCVGPTLGAVMGLAATAGQTNRAVVLALAYCLGLGIPFVLFGLFFPRLLGLFRAVRRHSRWVTAVGGVLLVAIGLALVTSGWNAFLIWLQTTVGVGTVGL